ncbi:hypothetical protein [Anaerospora sp.]|uniref:hypothetical protein n=1 Tax=Anaerospora sp. TaxID=1960278 RepID=UPI00289956D8|nr:hypothetical protein [Anaerospora sp.]
MIEPKIMLWHDKKIRGLKQRVAVEEAENDHLRQQLANERIKSAKLNELCFKLVEAFDVCNDEYLTAAVYLVNVQTLITKQNTKIKGLEKAASRVLKQHIRYRPGHYHANCDCGLCKAMKALYDALGEAR